MKTTIFSIVLVLSLNSVFAQKTNESLRPSVVATSLAAHKDQNPFRAARFYDETPPSVKSVSKTFNYEFNEYLDLGEDFCMPEVLEPTTHLAKKDIMQQGNPVFEIPKKEDPIAPHNNPLLKKQ